MVVTSYAAMFDNLLGWLADWRHVVFLLAAVTLLYVAREAAHRLLRASFQFAGHTSHCLRVGFRAPPTGC